MKSLALILSKNDNSYVNYLKNNLNINTKIIFDYHYDDKNILNFGFYNLTATIKKPSAWDKSFFLISESNLIHQYDYFYFIEDDVFSRDIKQINSLISFLDNNIDESFISHYIKSKTDSANWHWWKKNNLQSLGVNFWDNKCKLYKSFNPFCRLSSNLVQLVLNFRAEYNKFYFHEILFPTLSIQNNMKMFDLSTNYVSKNYFDIFRYRPIIDKYNICNDKIYHPVKPNYSTETFSQDEH